MNAVIYARFSSHNQNEQSIEGQIKVCYDYAMKLKKNGVRVISARENITDDASGVLMEAVLEGMAKYYRVMKKIKCKWNNAPKIDNNINAA